MLRCPLEHDLPEHLSSVSSITREAFLVKNPNYPMARHRLALALPLMTVYLMKYRVPAYGILKTLHT